MRPECEDRTATRPDFPGFTGDGAKKCDRPRLQGRRHPALPSTRPPPPPITIWHHGGIPAKVLAKRAGHARASKRLDVYSHVMPLEEVELATLQAAVVTARMP
jgi:hypothetical protein